jgi:hypothetical protein
MRDGSSDLYERDFVAWTRAQVAALRRLAAVVIMQPELDANYRAVRDNAYPFPRSAGGRG